MYSWVQDVELRDVGVVHFTKELVVRDVPYKIVNPTSNMSECELLADNIEDAVLRIRSYGTTDLN